MITVLENLDKILTKKLYGEAFSEDSEQFIEYYYRYKTLDNKIIVDRDGEEIQAMLHLNPYSIAVCEYRDTIDYIVAVATSLKYRRQGKMRGVLLYSLEQMYKEKKGFTFLLPANPVYYQPFGFTYISNFLNIKPKIDLKSIKLTSAETQKEAGIKSEDILAFWQECLEQKYDLYCIRSLEYLEKLYRELATEQGYIEVFLDKDIKIIGTQIIWGIEKREIRESIFKEEFASNQVTDKGYMMARIIHLEEFIKVIRLREDSLNIGETFKLRIKDDLIRENDGTYLWHINRETSYLEKLEKEDTIAVPEFDIAELTSWLFGYTNSYKADFCMEIQTLEGVFINEVV